MVKTRLLETVAAPSGRVGTLVSHSTFPLARFSASISPVGFCVGRPLTWLSFVSVNGRSIVARYTLPPAAAMSVSTPPSAPGS